MEKGITEIGKQAFAQFYNLSEIEFPSTLTKIGEAAFLGVINLQVQHCQLH
ncbi:MAG: leucine-rich repeat protein [Anaerostipes hadrus]